MANFDDAQKFVHKAEGGYQADPRDRGNWTSGKRGAGELVGTKYGISAPVLSRYLGRTCTVQDMKALPYTTALAIYRDRYWDPLELDLLHDQQLALLLYDAAVNQGSGVARAALFKALEGIGATPTDARFTAHMVSLANQYSAEQLHPIAWEYRLSRYPKESPFYAGWMKRLNRLKRA